MHESGGSHAHSNVGILVLHPPWKYLVVTCTGVTRYLLPLGPTLSSSLNGSLRRYPVRDNVHRLSRRHPTREIQTLHGPTPPSTVVRMPRTSGQMFQYGFRTGRVDSKPLTPLCDEGTPGTRETLSLRIEIPKILGDVET